MTDYQISVVVDSDTEGLASGADQAAGAIDELGSKAEAAGTTIDSGMATAGESVAGLASATGEASGTITEDLSAAGESVTGLGETVSGTADAVDTATTAIGASVADIPTAASTAADSVSSAASDMTDAFDGLSTEASDAAIEIQQSLAQEIPASVDTSAASITTKSGKFKAVGTALGTQLSDGIAAGAGGPEAALSLSQALSGLVAVTAKSGPGIVAALGIGAGFAVFKNIVDASAKAKAAIQADTDAWASSIIDNLGKIDVAVRRSNFERELADKTSELSHLADSLGDNAFGALTRAMVGTPDQRQAAISDLRTMLDTTRGQIGPMQQLVLSGEGNRDANVEALAALEGQKDELRGAINLVGDEVGKRVDANHQAELLLKNLQAVNALTPEEIAKMVTLGIHLDTAASHAQRLAYQAERTRQALEAADAAAASISTGLSNAATQAGIIGDVQ